MRAPVRETDRGGVKLFCGICAATASTAANGMGPGGPAARTTGRDGRSYIWIF